MRRLGGVTYSSLIGEKMEPTPGTVPDEKQIVQWIAAKPLSDQEQSVNLLWI